MIKKRFNRYFGLAVCFLLGISFIGCAKRVAQKAEDKSHQAVEEAEDEALDRTKDKIKEKLLPW